MPEDPKALARRLAVKALDAASTENEQRVCARKVCELVVREGLLDVEEHQRPSVVRKRVPGPFYLRRETADYWYFIRWREAFAFRGIVEGENREYSVLRSACEPAWMSDAEKRRVLGCCPGNPVAAWIDVAVAGSG